MAQPQGYVDSTHPQYVCKLNRSLYGLKQAPRAWFERLANYLHQLKFVSSKEDNSLFMLTQGPNCVFLLVYVDDIVLTGSCSHLVNHIIQALQQEFPIRDLGTLYYFLGLQLESTSEGTFLSQTRYLTDLLHKHDMADYKPCSTSM